MYTYLLLCVVCASMYIVENNLLIQGVLLDFLSYQT